MGYRIVVMDPDPACPVAAIADRVVVGAYDYAAAAVELARSADVVTYELEHVDPAHIDAVETTGVPVRPGAYALRIERRKMGHLTVAGAPDVEAVLARGRAALAKLRWR